MAITQLTDAQQSEIFNQLKIIFQDLAFFDQLVAEKLRKVIQDTNKIEIDAKTTRKVVERYYDVNEYKTPAEKALMAQLQVILRTAYTLILSYYPENKAEMYPDVETLLDHYPQFRDCDEEEKTYLLRFRNYLHFALKIVPARLSKQLLLKIAARLEGSRREYITGGGQKQAVTRRVDIYEQEGGTVADKRPPRLRISHASNSSNNLMEAGAAGINRKRPASKAVVQHVKLQRLPSDDVARLRRNPNDPSSAPPHAPYSHSRNSFIAPNAVSSSSGSSSSSSNSSSGTTAMTTGAPVSMPPPLPMASANQFQMARPPVVNQQQIPIRQPDPPALQRGLSDFSFGDQFDLSDWLQQDLPEKENLMPPPPAQPPIAPAIVPMDASIGGNAFYSGFQPTVMGNAHFGGLSSSQLSDSFPPNMSRTTSDALNNLLPGGIGWNLLTSDEYLDGYYDGAASSYPGPNDLAGSSYSGNPMNPINMMRSISWDIYNGTLSDDLKRMYP